MTTDSWTDARVDHELVAAFALTGGDVDSPTFRAVYNRMIGLRDDLAAQLAAAQQRIDETTSTLVEINRQWSELQESQKTALAKQGEQFDQLLAILNAAQQWIPIGNWRHKGRRGIDPYWIELDGQKLRLTDAYGVFTVELPDGYTICRRRQAQEGAG